MRFWLTIASSSLRIEVDNEGFLLYPSEWTVSIAEQIARDENIELEEMHWRVVNFVREQFELNQVVSETRHVLRMLKVHYGEEKATRKSLYRLFPYGYGQQACKIAGMRKPLKLMLDV
jgi:TusE/DsrC/DsvC family sulfur relay protein